MTGKIYYSPEGGLPPQSQLLSGRAIFKTAYAFIPKGVMTDIVISRLPLWTGARFWVLSRPLSGFAETFSWMIAEVEPGGGSDPAGDRPGGRGRAVRRRRRQWQLTYGWRHPHDESRWLCLSAAAGSTGRSPMRRQRRSRFHWIRKSVMSYVAGHRGAGSHSSTSDAERRAAQAMPNTDGDMGDDAVSSITEDMRHDMQVTIVNLQARRRHSFHGNPCDGTRPLRFAGQRRSNRLNEDWVEVEAGDYMWLRAFCPQACYAGGPEEFRYLLYKDVHRLPALGAKL